MTQSSKGAAVFLTLFGLPFLGGGLLVLFAQLTTRPNAPMAKTITSVMASLVLVLVGGGLIYAAISSYGRLKKQAAIEESNPLSPWLWRTDWASRRAGSQNKNSEIASWIMAIFCNLITLPFLFGMVPDFLRLGDPRVILLLGFNLVGAILFIKAVRATIRHRRFDNTYFEFDALPFSPGEHVGGRIHLKLDTLAEHGIDLRLSCLRKVVAGSGDSRKYQSNRHVAGGAKCSRGGRGPRTARPRHSCKFLDFRRESEHGSSKSERSNSLDAPCTGGRAGRGLLGRFRNSGFRSAASSMPASDFGTRITTGADNFGFAPPQTGDADSGEVSQPAHAKVIASMGSGGTEFYFPAFRNPGRALILLLVTVFWSAVVFVLYHTHAPILFFTIFGLADLLLIAGTLHVTLGSARISVGSGEILSRMGIFGLGRTRRIQVSNVASIVPVATMQQGTSSGKPLLCDSSAIEGRAQIHTRGRNRQPPGSALGRIADRNAGWLKIGYACGSGFASRRTSTTSEADIRSSIHSVAVKHVDHGICGRVFCHGDRDDWFYGVADVPFLCPP